MCLGALLGPPSDPIADPCGPGDVPRTRTPYFAYIKPLVPDAAASALDHQPSRPPPPLYTV